MSSKKTNLEMIARHLNENDDVHSAVDVWFSSYQKISAKEFLECNESYFGSEILEIIEDEIMMLTSARDEIKRHLNILEGK
jgi:hypothetical protein